MKRSKLKEILEKRKPESRRYYRLYRDLSLCEDFLRIVAENHTKKYRAAKNFARYDVCEQYGVSEKTFYVIRNILRSLCEDV